MKHIKRRLLAKVVYSPNGCWEILTQKARYPSLHVAGKTVRVNRLAWLIYRGEIPSGLHVLHTCDNTKCCNPEHLFLGTERDNLLDCYNKRRRKPPVCPPEKKARGDKNGMRKYPGILSGSKNGRAKLNEDQRRELRACRQKGEKIVVLAVRFNLSVSQVSRITNTK